MITVNEDRTVSVNFGASIAGVAVKQPGEDLVYVLASEDLPSTDDPSQESEGVVVHLRFPNIRFLEQHIAELSKMRDAAMIESYRRRLREL